MTCRICQKCTYNSRKQHNLSILVIAIVSSFYPTFAHAIPSPELVIGSISSLSQLFALVAAMFGGGAVAFGARSSLKGGKHNQYSKSALKFAAVFAILFFVSAGFNIYQYTSQNDRDLIRLQSTLVRPGRVSGQKVLDTSLKELAFSNQGKHNLSITTQEVAKIMTLQKNTGQSDVLFLDVRESPEYEMGTLPGVKHVRFPDFSTAKIDFAKQKQVVLLCHNGNRSSETCEKLAEQGIDCKFIAGGIEKWIVEGRAFTDENVRTLSDLRSIPEYKNKDVLLDTDVVHEMRDNEDAVFIDVRYPGKFEVSHLPDATNIPIRKTPTAALNEQISKLPKKPIIAACYDRRSCFSSQVLGLELTRAGYDFRGRYTLPWEYFITPKPKPHVAAWLAEQNIGLWQKAVNFISSLIASISERWNMVAAVILAAFISRMLVLPISLKAEKDQIRMNALSSDFDTLKLRYKDDPKRKAFALKKFYNQNNITPLRNLLALAFVPIMAINLSAVESVAKNTDGVSFLWLDLSARDPYLILPILFGFLCVFYILITVAKKKMHRLLTWVLGLPIFTAIAALLTVAGDLYLNASLLFLLMQRGFASGFYDSIIIGLKKAWGKYFNLEGLIPLSREEELIGCGNKAFRLSQLRSRNVAVPDGVVLTESFLANFKDSDAHTKKTLTDKIWKSFNGKSLAVRSSAAAEDGESNSFAGVFESILRVGKNDLEEAINKVSESFTSLRASSYGTDGNGGNILVQEMVEAEYAGVLFTQAPGEPGIMFVELVEGISENFVSGLATPAAFKFGRSSYDLVGEAPPPIDLTELLKIGTMAETHFKAPQDIEWTYLNGAFLIVQSRDITALNSDEFVEVEIRQEWQKLLNIASSSTHDTLMFEQDEMSEVLPKPTPLSLSIMQSLWGMNGSVDIACDRLGLTYPVDAESRSKLVTIFGRLYTDKVEEKNSSVLLNKATITRLKKQSEAIDTNFSEDFIPEFLEKIEIYELVNFLQLSKGRIFDHIKRLHDDFVQVTHAEIEIINIATSFYMDHAKELLEKLGHDPAVLLANTEKIGPARVIADALDIPEKKRLKFLHAEMGHRATFDYELNVPRYCDDIASLNIFAMPTAVGGKDKNPDKSRDISTAHLPPKVEKMVLAARRFQILKEEAKHYSLRQFAMIRKAVLAFDEKLELNGLIFFLTFDEIFMSKGKISKSMRKIAKYRKAQSKRFNKLPPLPASLTVAELEVASAKNTGTTEQMDGVYQGTRVSGSGIKEGRCKVIRHDVAENGDPIAGFEDGDIIVCTMVHPAWLPYIIRSGGVVSEVGGWLSHIAIVAREHQIPMIVNVRNLQNIENGSSLRLHPSGNIEVF